jgi:hypothetical protein
MADTPAADERLAGVIARLDIALLLDEAGVDVRSFAPHELDALSRTLVRRQARSDSRQDAPAQEE